MVDLLADGVPADTQAMRPHRGAGRSGVLRSRPSRDMFDLVHRHREVEVRGPLEDLHDLGGGESDVVAGCGERNRSK